MDHLDASAANPRLRAVSPKRKPIGRGLLTLAAVATGLLPLLTDANRSALFDPQWSGHAHYHTSMVIVLGLELGLIGLWLLWYVGRSFGVTLASMLLTIFWAGYVIALGIPGTSLPHHADAGLTMDLGIIGGMLILIGTGYALYRPTRWWGVREPRRSGGRVLLSVLAVITLAGAPLFDFNQDHVFNPAWAAYARYHVGVHVPVTMMLMVVVLWLLWWVWPRMDMPRMDMPRVDTPRVDMSTIAFGLATALVSAFWITFYTAEIVPGTANVDPGQPLPHIGSFPVYQLTAAIPFTLLIALAGGLYYRARRAAIP